MSETFESVAGAPGSGLLVVVDHAANRVPPDVDLGIEPALLDLHIGWDIGAAALGRLLCADFACPGLLGTVSRLVIDLHREPDSPALIPTVSDGHLIPANEVLDEAGRQARIARFWKPYHDRLETMVDEERPGLIVAVHSFTPELETVPGQARPWEIGILYNQDDRAPRIAIAALREAGIATGDNEPYSGRLLNYTMNRHAEARGIPYLAIEVRNDLLRSEAGIRRWADVLEPVIRRCRDMLAEDAASRP